MKTNITEDIWYAKSNPDDMKNLVDSFKNQLIQFYFDLKSLLSEYNTNDSLLSNIYSITVLGELLSEMNEFKKEQNIEQISVFNKKINNVIVKQPSSYILKELEKNIIIFLSMSFKIHLFPS